MVEVLVIVNNRLLFFVLLDFEFLSLFILFILLIMKISVDIGLFLEFGLKDIRVYWKRV